VEAVSWTALAEEYNKLFFHDILIYYRVPAIPIVVKSIEKARSLGRVLIYEIDDLIFDPVYPPPYESYGGSISISDYAGLLAGMPLFREAAMLCDYAIASTVPLLEELQELVTTKKGYLHRNALDSKNIFLESVNSDYIDIFYGSGTLAHNSDFIELALPAIIKILNRYENVRFTVVGHLRLPKDFLSKYASRIRLIDRTETIEEYWNYLREADINLAVLHADRINDCKSELKWFEAACFAIPSIVSNTRNYRDVVRDGVDALTATEPKEWFEAMARLIEDGKLRQNIGRKALERVKRGYSIEAMSENIDAVIRDILDKRVSNG